jgi:hypothetical protein
MTYAHHFSGIFFENSTVLNSASRELFKTGLKKCVAYLEVLRTLPNVKAPGIPKYNLVLLLVIALVFYVDGIRLGNVAHALRGLLCVYVCIAAARCGLLCAVTILVWYPQRTGRGGPCTKKKKLFILEIPCSYILLSLYPCAGHHEQAVRLPQQNPRLDTIRRIDKPG